MNSSTLSAFAKSLLAAKDSADFLINAQLLVTTLRPPVMVHNYS